MRRNGNETYVLCLSESRKEKDRPIREKQEKKFLNDFTSVSLLSGQK